MPGPTRKNGSREVTMARIRVVEVSNFRAIKELKWLPGPGINCLIGPGDSGKSSILEAIDLCLGARRSITFSDADFYRLDTAAPIKVALTIGALDDSTKSLDTYGQFLRGFGRCGLGPAMDTAIRPCHGSGDHPKPDLG
jgi:AAA ATPase domain